MAKSSLDDSVFAENLYCSCPIASDHLAEGAALLRAVLDNVFMLCHPSLTHEHLWARHVCIENAEAHLDLGRKAKRELKLMRCAR